MQENLDLTQLELAEKLDVRGLSYWLNALIEKGLVKMQNFFSNSNKFKCIYLFTPMGIAKMVALTTLYISRKMKVYEALKLEISYLENDLQNIYFTRK